MRKWVLYLLVFIVLSTISVFIFIPSSINISGFETVNCPNTSALRLIGQKNAIKKWWPGDTLNDSVYLFRDTRYSIRTTTDQGITLQAETGDLIVTGKITAVFLQKDTSVLAWGYEGFNTGINPLKRITTYLSARRLKNQLTLILENLKKIASNPQNIYGFPVIQAKVKDSSLIAIQGTYDHVLTSKEISDIIDRITMYMNANGGVQKGDPIMNITVTEDHRYATIVAVPIESDIPAKGEFVIKKLLMAGNDVETKVTGGPATIALAEEAIANYMKDYGKFAPVLPYQVMVTNRYKEKDTAKWVTYLRHPVF